MEQLLVSLFLTQGGFTAQVNLGPDAIEKSPTMKMSENVQQAIFQANPYPEGRWLFIPVETDDDFGYVKRLLAMSRNEIPSKIGWSGISGDQP